MRRPFCTLAAIALGVSSPVGAAAQDPGIDAAVERYVDQIIEQETPFARNIALSPDEEQQFLYVGGGPGIMVFNRLSLRLLTSIETTVGTGHHIQTDSQGNIYIAATGVGYERLIYMGLSSESSN